MENNHLYRFIETSALLTDRVLVSFSGGKDSVVTLDLCVKNFNCVEGFFMYEVEGLSFQEAIIRYYEDKYGIPIYRIPHFDLSKQLRYGLYRPFDPTVPVISTKEVYDYMREMTDIFWIAAGERIDDSLWRRAMIKSTGTIDEKRGRFFPIAEWNKLDVKAYIRQNKLYVGSESARLGSSFGSLSGKESYLIKKHYPADYERIKKWFPLVEVSIINAKMRGLINE